MLKPESGVVCGVCDFRTTRPLCSPLKVRLSVDSQRELAKVASFSKAENPARKSSRNLVPPTNGKRNTVGLGKFQVPFYQHRITPVNTAKMQTTMSIIPVASTAPSLYESEDQFTTTSATIEDQIGLYVWLEVLSLLVLYLVIQRRFGFSILHQLAFVLETHAMQVQGRMFVWTAFILTFTLEHFGGYSTDSCSK